MRRPISDASFRWAVTVLAPLVGALLGPEAAGGQATWVVKAAAGFCFGLGISFAMWGAGRRSPLGLFFAALAAVTPVLGVVLVAVSIDGGLVLALILIAGLVFWGVTHLES